MFAKKTAQFGLELVSAVSEESRAAYESEK